MSRILFVVQERTARRFPIPPPLSPEMKSRLCRGLLGMQHVRGPWAFTPSGEEFYTDWYMERKDSGGEAKLYAGYSERKPDHLLRLAMCLGATQKNCERFFTEDLLKEALAVLDWLETQLPEMFDQLQTTEAGQEQQRVLQLIRQAGGSLEHSELLRKAHKWANARTLKMILQSLTESKMVGYDSAKLTYYITSRGWK